MTRDDRANGVNRWRRHGPWVVLLVLAAAVLAYAAWPRPGGESPGARTHRLATQIHCVDCQGLSVADSSTESARAARADIKRRIAAGESDARIRQAFVDRYGESVLLQPPSRGIGMLVWALPVVVLVLGGGGIALALRRWQRQPRLVATDADEALVGRARGSGR